VGETISKACGWGFLFEMEGGGGEAGMQGSGCRC